MYFVGNALERSACDDTAEVNKHLGTVKTVPYVQTVKFIVIS